MKPGYYPLWIPGHITLSEIVDIFHEAGFRLRSDGAGRTVVEPLPRIVVKDSIPSNVVPMRRRGRKELS